MKTITILIFFLVIISYSNCSVPETPKGKKDKLVLITTKFGDIKIKLYEKTPQHTENFYKLVGDGFYDSTLFHRIIPEFMLQGGDPESKNAVSEANLGNGGPGYTIPAEFVSEYIHKRGAVAAARLGDNMNPEKRSSGSQFYIVQGKVFANDELDKLEANINNIKKREYFKVLIEKPAFSDYKILIDSLQKSRNMQALNQVAMELQPLIDSAFVSENTVFKFTEVQRKTYTTEGGTPHLDGGYTVFGEVIEGMEVVDKIAVVERNKKDRPLEDIVISIKVIQ